MTYSYKQFCSLLVCLTLACSTFGKTIYVKANAINGENDGVSWENAYIRLADALAEAEEGDQIWVAAGTYYPTSGTNRSISFVIPNGVKILGGFPNTGNPTLANRNPSANPTILSGDIDQNGDLTGNAYTVIYTKDVDDSTIVDGFSIVDGNADGAVPADFPVNRQNGGAAWFNEASNFVNSEPTIKNCIFSGHHASNRGAAMFHKASAGANANYTIESCTFINNIADRSGGAIFNNQSGSNSICAPIISNSTFQSNTAGQSGGAVYNNGAFFGEVSGTYTNCVFNNNKAIGNEGGAVYNNAFFQGESNPNFNNCDFVNNDANTGSGGAIYTDASGNGISNFSVTNCLFDGNISNVYAGAICNIISNNGSITPIYANCVFKENSSFNGGATYSRAVFGGDILVTVTNSVFYKNTGNVGGSIYQNQAGAASVVSTNVSNSIFKENTAGFSPTFHLTGPSSINLNNNIFDVSGCLDLVQGEGTSEANCTGNNIFNQDPLFANAAGGDFHVPANSPAVDAGNNADVPSYLTQDADGNPRIATGIVDLGIYEQVNTIADSDGDGVLDINDNCPLIANTDQANADGDSAGTLCDCDDSPATGVSCTTGCSSFYLDNDGDGFGNPTMSVTTCVAPANYVTDNTDFNDNDNTLYPNAPELCDEKDNNNDGQVDEGTDDDNDGVCNEDDICPGGDDTVDLNNNNIPDDCESLISLDCPSDITVSATAGQTSALVSWVEPTATTDCNGGGSGGGSCSGDPITGFTYKGEHNGKEYYLSEEGRIWTDAKAICEANGGNLVVINDQAENEFVRGFIAPNIVHIGLTDQETEGIYQWVNGDPLSFNNLENPADGMDYGLMYFWGNGAWNLSGNYSKIYVLEKSCGGGTGGGLELNQTAGFANGAAFPIGTTTVTYTAEDDCDGIKTCSFTVTVEATNSDLSIACPSNITINAAPGATSAIANWSNPTVNSTCPTGTPTATPSQASGTAFPIGVTTVTYTATDDCGGSETCSFDVTVIEGSSNLTLDCPSDIVLTADPGATSEIVTWANPATSTDCTTGIVTVTASQNSGTAFPTGTTTVTLTATDDCGATTTCVFDVTVNEGSSVLNLTCPTDITVTADPGETSKIVNWANPATSTDCTTGIVTVAASQNSGTAFPTGTTTVTLTATDDCGATTTCVFDVTVNEGTSALNLTCPTDITVTADPGETSKIVNWANPATSTDCTTGIVTVAASQNSGTAFPTGTTTVTLTATDDCGATTTCVFDVTVNEGTSALNLTCPTDITVTADPGETSKIVNWANPATSTDCTTGIVTVAASQNSGTAFPTGTTTVTLTATDDCGATTTCVFDVTVNEGSSVLNLTCPTDITVTADPGETSKIVNWANPATSTDCTTGIVTVAASQNSGTAFPTGTTTVTLTVTDGCGSTTTCSFDVTVNQGTSNLILNCPSDIVMDAATGATSKEITYSNPIGNTTCTISGVNLTLLNGLASGSAFPIGTTLVEYQGTDNCGSTAICSFNVTVNAVGSNLQITCPTDITETVTSASGTVAVTWTDPIGGSNCAAGGYNIIQTAGPAKGSEFGVGSTTITYTATDNCGGSETCSFTVTVNLDNSSLSLACPSNISTTTPEGSGGKVVTWAVPTATTDCTLDNGTGNSCPDTPDPIAGYTYLGEFNGSIYYISDGKAPWLTAKTNAEVAGGTLASIESQAENDYILSIINGEIVQIGLTDMDSEGNPIWLNGEPTDFQNFSGFTSNSEERDYTVLYHWDGTWDWVSNGSWKHSLLEVKCGGPSPSIPTITQTAGPTSGSIFPVGTTTITYQAADDCNNLTTCSFTVTVTETVVVCNPDTDGGQISGNELICDPYDPQTISSTTLPTGGAGTIEYVWLKSETGCPTNISQAIANTNSATYNPPFITTTTYYARWSRRADCTDWVASNCITKTVDDCGSTNEYCTLSADQPWQEWISKVTLADLDNNSGKSLGYDDYTNLVANLTTGQEYTVSVNLTFSYNQWDEGVYVWMDFNQDNDFNDPGELVLDQVSTSNGNGGPQPPAITQTFTVPANAVPGNTRMRVAMKREIGVNTCGSFVHGEVEDYTLNIAAGASNRAKPVLAFEAYPVTGHSFLEWFSNTTDLEYSFEVERSFDNQQFEKIDNVMVHYENDYDSFYKIVDEQPELGENYYRIKQVFADGKIAYTDTKKLVYGNKNAKLQFYPNPANEVLYVDANELAGFRGRLMIVNMLGQVMTDRVLDEIPSGIIEIPLEKFDNGMHSLIIQVNGKRIKTELFVVEKMR